MRTVDRFLCAAVALVIAAALGSPEIHAETPATEKVERVDEVDALQLELARARVQLAAKDLEEAQRTEGALIAAARTKYKLGEGDLLSVEARRVIRKRKPEATKK
jgi:hypothetical protein